MTDPLISNHRAGVWEARAWSCHAKTTVGRIVDGKWEPIAECSGHGRHSSEDEKFSALIVAAIMHLKTPRTPRQHDGEDCKDDEAGASVCDGIYADRTDEVLGLVEALDAIRALVGGHSAQAKAITKIIDDAIEEHAAWTR